MTCALSRKTAPGPAATRAPIFAADSLQMQQTPLAGLLLGTKKGPSPGLVPGVHAFKTWVAGASPATW